MIIILLPVRHSDVCITSKVSDERINCFIDTIFNYIIKLGGVGDALFVCVMYLFKFNDPERSANYDVIKL